MITAEMYDKNILRNSSHYVQNGKDFDERELVTSPA